MTKNQMKMCENCQLSQICCKIDQPFLFNTELKNFNKSNFDEILMRLTHWGWIDMRKILDPSKNRYTITEKGSKVLELYEKLLETV